MHVNYKNNCLFIGVALQCTKNSLPCKYYETACPYNTSKKIVFFEDGYNYDHKEEI